MLPGRGLTPEDRENRARHQDTVEAFTKEYVALCRKHGAFVCGADAEATAADVTVQTSHWPPMMAKWFDGDLATHVLELEGQV